MKQIIHNKKKRQAARRERQRDQARKLMHQIVNGEGDLYIHYTDLFGIWCAYASWHEDLRPFFRIDGVDAADRISVDDAFKEKVRTIAADWLRKDSEQIKLM